MKNNSMAELYNEFSNKIVKPNKVNMRNSVNGGATWHTAASSHSKTFDRTNRRSDSIEHEQNSSKRLLNREDLMCGSPLSPG